MARNAEECRTMIEACDKNDVPLFVAYYRRSLPRFLKVKELIEKGRIGDVRFAAIQHTKKPVSKQEDGTWPWRVLPEESGGGLLYDVGSHTLDLFDFLLGPLTEIKGAAHNFDDAYPAEDTVRGSWKFENGAVGTGVWNFSSYRNWDTNRIVGTRGEIIFSTFGDESVKLVTGFGEESFYIEHPAHIQYYHIQSIVNELLGRGTCPSTGKSALRTNRVMEELVENYYFS
ncbi:Gfo/Idh/MocA family protein [Salimicrobium jeotgali]|uniref:Gfo/Idh/MocA family protein n=1 Tax=Salimicrobium jeotgali TaxID=1230341 RepID=UPI0035B536BF